VTPFSLPLQTQRQVAVRRTVFIRDIDQEVRAASCALLCVHCSAAPRAL
jgi:hypothetical protein